MKDVGDIPRSLWNKKQVRKYLQWHKIYIYDTENDYILYEIMHCDHIEYEIKIHIDKI